MWASLHKKHPGFTIVELLIVIVVVAILAAITIVAYNGIQARANNSVVQSNLQQIAKQLSLFYVDNSRYPTAFDLSTGNPRLNFSKNSYQTADNAVLYCSSADGSNIALIAKSKTNTSYYITNTNFNVRVFVPAFPWGVVVDCPNAGVADYTAAGWIHTLGSGWVAWVNS